MKTTLNLDDELLLRAKRRAAERGSTLTAVVEDALRSALNAPTVGGRFRLELPIVDGGEPPRIDPADRAALYEVLDER